MSITINEDSFEIIQGMANAIHLSLEKGANEVAFLTSQNLVKFVGVLKGSLEPTPQVSKYSIYFESDDDFSIKFKDKTYYGDEYIFFNSIDDLDEMEVLGPWGGERKEHTKCWEWEEGIKAIKQNPEENYRRLGGNRGLEFCINGKED